MTTSKRVFAAFLTLHTIGNCQAKEVKLSSPQKDYVVVLRLDEQTGRASYNVSFQGQSITLDSALGFLTADGESIGANLSIRDIARSEVRNSWRPPYGTRERYPDNYNQAFVSFESNAPGQPTFDLVLRAYDEGVALRYVFRSTKKSSLNLQQELTEFVLPAGTQVWASKMSQGEILKSPVQSLTNVCERPLLSELPNSLYVAIGEAAQVDFPRMKLQASSGKDSAVRAWLEGPASAKLPFSTPWRFLMAGRTAGEILENNYLILNLNEPNQLGNTAWIKPGKVIRDVTLTTQGGKACVDFAVEHGLQYVIESAGWYGNEFSAESDAATVTLDPKRSTGPLDLQEVIRYGREKDIGILVYVNRNQLEKQLDEILPLYQEWGIAGIKYGFVRTGDQYWSSWLHEAVRKAANHGMVLSIHDDYRPIGYSRTYPNLMTVEGIRGEEESPTNEHTLITMFTRMIAGAGDNTICYYDNRVESMGSHASQLAKAVCLYSPLTWLYWYDRPQGAPLNSGGAGGAETVIGAEPELEFFDAVPTVWDDTRVIHSEVGVLGTIARRKGAEWFLGTINAGTDREITIDCDFLEADCDYIASVYFDDPSVETRTHVGIQHLNVTNQTTIKRLIKANNGLAIHIRPKVEQTAD